MVTFQIESWSAMAPGLETTEAWKRWLQHPQAVHDPLGKVPLKQIPPMLRRRFSTLGKCAVGAALPLLDEAEAMPSIFASRHGDTALTLSLLEDMGRDEPMSPTGFSLAVHNAVSGLFSIARKDLSEVTSIAAMEGLVVQTLLEAVGQLQESNRVLCVIYDVPLPDLYRRYSDGDSFPYAIAMIVSRTEGEAYSLMQCEPGEQVQCSALPVSLDSEPLRFVGLLADTASEMASEVNGVTWRIAKVSL
ncbi:MAG: beta-ketoacyl synthase chain length factor [Amphritea sp.]